VIRPESAEFPDYRGYAGQVAGGVLRPGDDVTVLPSGLSTKITRIEQWGQVSGEHGETAEGGDPDGSAGGRGAAPPWDRRGVLADERHDPPRR